MFRCSCAHNYSNHAPHAGMESVFLRNGRYTGHVGLWLRPRLGCFGEESFKSITTAWPNAFSVRPSLALTRSELPSSETGGLVSPLAGFMHGVLVRKAGNVQAAFTRSIQDREPPHRESRSRRPPFPHLRRPL